METDSIFASNVGRPLADRMRPETIDDVVGQDELLGPDAPFRRMIDSGKLSSFILWGPPGCGKTTIAKILAGNSNLRFVAMSAVFSGVADLRKAFEEASRQRSFGVATLLFIDEIHRFNRAQQDGFLPYVENGTITLVGATTENPSFELNSALLSRCKVFVLKPLNNDALQKLIDRAEKITGLPLPADESGRSTLVELADGDGRYFINLLEAVYQLARPGEKMNRDTVLKCVQKRSPAYDKDRDGHYNLISAVHKSLRSSDTDAALYWTARMLAGGEDPKYLLRRLTRFASEDIGLADPNALQMAISAWESYDRLGSPEGELAIAQLVIYLGTAPKSNASYTAWLAAQKAAKKYGSLMPPSNILNAPTQLMKDLNYGAGYIYDPDTPEGFSGQNCFPEKMPRLAFYHPVERGFEREIVKRLAYWDRLRREKKTDAGH